jgi:hypothetical protein
LPLLDRSPVVNAIAARMPLTTDVDANDLIRQLAPPVPASAMVKGNDQWREQKLFLRQSEQLLRFAVAELLERGSASIVDRADGARLTVIKRVKHSDCNGTGRKILTPFDVEIFAVSDSIA